MDCKDCKIFQETCDMSFDCPYDMYLIIKKELESKQPADRQKPCEECKNYNNIEHTYRNTCFCCKGFYDDMFEPKEQAK